MEHLSGGQKKKVALAKTLTSSFEILLLDEPTNHLDGEMISWLEDYLKRYKGVVIMVTHDRYFLDKVTNRILEISRGKLYGYEANYSKFLEMKAEREEMELVFRAKTPKCVENGIRMGKARLPSKNNKAKGKIGAIRAFEKTEKLRRRIVWQRLILWKREWARRRLSSTMSARATGSES